jgi:hypothetical protein
VGKASRKDAATYKGQCNIVGLGAVGNDLSERLTFLHYWGRVRHYSKAGNTEGKSARECHCNKTKEGGGSSVKGEWRRGNNSTDGEADEEGRSILLQFIDCSGSMNRSSIIYLITKIVYAHGRSSPGDIFLTSFTSAKPRIVAQKRYTIETSGIR